ncbi:MAG: trypsin-like peptidase domain-containing protein [Betaproteobacteria bacterium AqS2]|uniref:Trypsin-like peptidase domain-containing protein n=1 Tax=Candidatus Amphirhobacter heronislandensis TaxID=1732024 RepID=A0A930UAT0_9GAMM|nr:trypsin-like peptidase domain-containing protein [Betaproteobacteria bacterium AqS2]
MKEQTHKPALLLGFLLFVLTMFPAVGHGPVDYSELYEKVSKSVVDIHDAEGYGGGTGVIISPDGYILTNAHVIYDYRNDEVIESLVSLQDKREARAQIIGYDQHTDIALLKIEFDEDLPAVQIGNSDRLRVGNSVLAIGHPEYYDYSLSSGVVSYLDRFQQAPTYDALECTVPFIQTDAAINEGNSGGPLLNDSGELIGIISAASNYGDDAGLNFAVPINLAMEVEQELRESGKSRWGMLGVYLEHGYDGGLLVNKISEGSGAEAAGIEPGDVIVEYNYMEVGNLNDFPCLMAGKKVPVKVIREGQELDLTVTLGAIEDGGRVAALN